MNNASPNTATANDVASGAVDYASFVTSDMVCAPVEEVLITAAGRLRLAGLVETWKCEASDSNPWPYAFETELLTLWDVGEALGLTDDDMLEIAGGEAHEYIMDMFEVPFCVVDEYEEEVV